MDALSTWLRVAQVQRAGPDTPTHLHPFLTGGAGSAGPKPLITGNRRLAEVTTPREAMAGRLRRAELRSAFGTNGWTGSTCRSTGTDVDASSRVSMDGVTCGLWDRRGTS